MFKKIVFGWLAAVFTTMVWANCSTHTIMSGSRVVTCTTCCYFGNCTTNCF